MKLEGGRMGNHGVRDGDPCPKIKPGRLPKHAGGGLCGIGRHCRNGYGNVGGGRRLCLVRRGPAPARVFGFLTSWLIKGTNVI